jgi:hypothetical protein
LKQPEYYHAMATTAVFAALVGGLSLLIALGSPPWRTGT